MKKIESFTHRGKRNRYPFPEIAATLGTVWELEAGVDFDGVPERVARAAHFWAKRHGADGKPVKPADGPGALRAVTSVPPGGGSVQIMFEEK